MPPPPLQSIRKTHYFQTFAKRWYTKNHNSFVYFWTKWIFLLRSCQNKWRTVLYQPTTIIIIPYDRIRVCKAIWQKINLNNLIEECIFNLKVEVIIIINGNKSVCQIVCIWNICQKLSHFYCLPNVRND